MEEKESNLTEDQFERILKDPEEETPKVAKELYPNDTKSQKDFVEDISNAVETIASTGSKEK
jgi:hypothetical protein